jgi:hypothetical protein
MKLENAQSSWLNNFYLFSSFKFDATFLPVRLTKKELLGCDFVKTLQ